MNRAEHLLRIPAALAILLLAVVQERICPWLDQPVEPQTVASEAGQAPDDEPEEPPPLQLLSVLPDALVPRSAAGLRAGATDRRHVPVAGIAAEWDRSDDPQACGEFAVRDATAPFPRPAAERVATIWQHRSALNPALHTSITPTGPPAA